MGPKLLSITAHSSKHEDVSYEADSVGPTAIAMFGKHADIY